MDLRLRLIETQSQLIDSFPLISDLFLRSFSRELHYELWEWAYISNPYGDPCVALAECNGQVVGHYATIPIILTNASGLSLNSHLSMTTMIDRSHIKHNLFQKLAELVYSRLESIDTFCVYGYPNAKSKPGFTKRLSWTTSELAIKSFDSVGQYIQTSMYKNYFSPSSNSFSIDLTLPHLLAWRFSKPGATYRFIDGAYFKTYGSMLDLMYVQSHKDFEASCMSTPFNALCGSDEHSHSSPTTTYYSGYKTFGSARNIELFSQLSCSDVF
jgi:hypothetical protein